MPLNEESFIARVALRHSLSPEAVRPILRALRSGGGSMSQLSSAPCRAVMFGLRPFMGGP
jgi:hypothetical protein